MIYYYTYNIPGYTNYNENNGKKCFEDNIIIKKKLLKELKKFIAESNEKDIFSNDFHAFGNIHENNHI